MVLDSHYQYINELVLKAQQGESDALVEIEHFYQPLINASINRCINKESALRHRREDLEREVFIVLHDLIMAYEASAMTYFSYYLSTHIDYALITRAHKVLLSYSCASKGIEEVPFSEMPEDWEPESHHDPFGDLWMKSTIHDALDKLNDKQREAIDLYFFQDYTQEQAAELLGINQASFCKRLQRGIVRLRGIIPKEILD